MDKAEPVRIRRFGVVLAFALVAQMLCWAIMLIGREVTSLDNALIAHAIGAPIIAVVVSAIYYMRFNYTTPVQTAVVFISVVLAMDVLIIALLIEKSFAMFASPLGTWLPIASIFLATYLTGVSVWRRIAHRQEPARLVRDKESI